SLDRLVASDAFRGRPQLGAFLRYVADAALGGRAASLKGYTIGVEALGRDARFDPQTDPIVRVEATRLRRALERYYAGGGSGDPLVIDLPRGTYVPVFMRRGAPSQPPSTGVDLAREGHSPTRTYVRALAAILLFVALAGLAALVLPRRSGDRAPAFTAAIPIGPAQPGDFASGLPPGNGMPVIAIDTLRVVGA